MCGSSRRVRPSSKEPGSDFARVVLEIVFAQSADFHEGPEESDLEWLMAVNRDDEPFTASRLDEDMVAAVNSRELPTLSLGGPEEVFPRALLHLAWAKLNRHLHHLIALRQGNVRSDGQDPGFNRFFEMGLHFVERLPLGDATRQRRHFRPESSLFRFVDDRFQNHAARCPRCPNIASAAAIEPEPRLPLGRGFAMFCE